MLKYYYTFITFFSVIHRVTSLVHKNYITTCYKSDHRGAAVIMQKRVYDGTNDAPGQANKVICTIS